MKNLNKGAYILLIHLEDDLIVKRSRTFHLERGYYIYVGSAMNSLCGRVKYHLSEGKSGKWHIDELLKYEKARIEFVILLPSSERIEEKLVLCLSNMEEYLKVIEDFGSTDVKTRGNLLRILDFESFMKILPSIIMDIKRRGENS